MQRTCGAPWYHVSHSCSLCQAFSVLDILIGYDKKSQWLEIEYRKGFLAHFLNDLVSKQDQLMGLLNQEPGEDS